jgi:hypothetical protein
MSIRPFLPSLALLGALVPAGAGAADTAATLDPGSIQGLLFGNLLTNIGIAFTIVLMCIFGLYAYASLARFAPYHTWIYLYLVSLTGVVWSAYLLNNGGSLSDAVFILTTVAGVNLIVHVLRYDRIDLVAPKKQEQPVPLFFEV